MDGKETHILGSMPMGKIASIADLHAEVSRRITIEGGACLDSLFRVYQKQGAGGLRAIASKFNNGFLIAEFNEFQELGNEMNDEEKMARKKVISDLIDSAGWVNEELKGYGDTLARDMISPLLAKLSATSFYVVTWRNWKKLHQFDKAA